MDILGRKEIIRHQGKPLWARKLKGASGVYFGLHQHQLFQQYWEDEEESGKTPGQRAKKLWRRSQRRWRLFEEGLTSGSRGLRLAQLRGRQKDIPTLERASEFFGDALREAIISQEFFRFEKLPSAIQEALLRQGFAFAKTKKAGLQEVRAQIYFLFKGLDGTINVGAYLARATAISDRLKERLIGIYAWGAKYSADESILLAIQGQFDRITAELRRNLAFWAKHEVITKGHADPVQQKILQDKMVMASRQLAPYCELQPFAGWAWYTVNDLVKASKAVKEEDYLLARAILARISVSLAIKKQQRQLDNLLLKLGEDKAFGRWNGEFYLSTLKTLSSSFAELLDKEQAAKFAKPVCAEVLKYLQEAERFLPEKNFRKLKEPLKNVYLFL